MRNNPIKRIRRSELAFAHVRSQGQLFVVFDRVADFAPEGGETFEVDGEDCGGLVDREAFFGDDAAFASVSAKTNAFGQLFWGRESDGVAE